VLRQPNTMACWATVYTMMLSWKKQASFDIASAVVTVGETYLRVFQLTKYEGAIRRTSGEYYQIRHFV